MPQRLQPARHLPLWLVPLPKGWVASRCGERAGAGRHMLGSRHFPGVAAMPCGAPVAMHCYLLYTTSNTLLAVLLRSRLSMVTITYDGAQRSHTIARVYPMMQGSAMQASNACLPIIPSEGRQPPPMNCCTPARRSLLPCPAGFWGADCSLSMDEGGKPQLLAGTGYKPRARRPLVYVYDIPQHWSSWCAPRPHMQRAGAVGTHLRGWTARVQARRTEGGLMNPAAIGHAEASQVAAARTWA